MTGERRDLAPRQGSYVPTTFAETRELCDYLAKSELIPAEFRGKPHNIFIAIQYGADLGLSPMQALQSIAVFNGKPTLYGDVGLALALDSGLLEEFDEWYDEEKRVAHCKARRKGGKDIERTFGAEDADRALVWNKQTSKMEKLSSRFTYQSYPRRMHQMRARWWALRDTVPDVFKGLPGKEEYEDIQEPPPEPRDMGPAVRVDEPNPFAPRETTREAEESSPSPSAPPPATASSAPPPVAEEPGVPDRDRARVPGDPRGAAADPPAVGGPASAQEPPASEGPGDWTTVFELNGQRFATRGITKDQMLDLFKLCVQVNRKKGKLFDKDLLMKEFGVETRKDLTAETAEQYRIRLTEVLEEA